MRIRNTVILLAMLVGLIGLIPSGAQSDDPPTWQHSAKFVCGGQAEEGDDGDGRDSDVEPVVPGFYETAINVHNPNFSTVASESSSAAGTQSNNPFFSTRFRKKALILFATGGGDADNPRTPAAPEKAQPPGPWVRPDNLPYDWGFEIDCKDIREQLLQNAVPGTPVQNDNRDDDALLKGYVVIEARSSLPLDVTVAYTGYNVNEGDGGLTDEEDVAGFSEDVDTVFPKRIR